MQIQKIPLKVMAFYFSTQITFLSEHYLKCNLNKPEPSSSLKGPSSRGVLFKRNITWMPNALKIMQILTFSWKSHHFSHPKSHSTATSSLSPESSFFLCKLIQSVQFQTYSIPATTLIQPQELGEAAARNCPTEGWRGGEDVSTGASWSRSQKWEQG